MNIILALPMKNMNQLPPLVDFDQEWKDGPLSTVTASQTPAKPIVELIEHELPMPLRFTLKRKHISLWSQTIALTDLNHFRVVGLEWLQVKNGLPDLLLVHIESTNRLTENAVTFAEMLTRTWRKESKSLLHDLFGASELIHAHTKQGLCLMRADVSQETYPSFAGGVENRSYLQLHIAPEAPKFIHGVGAHVVTVVALQLFATEALNLLWPQDSYSRKEIQKFSEKFSQYQHIYNWTGIFTGIESRKIYRNFRDTLNTEQRFRDYREEIQELKSLIATKSSSRVGFIGAVFGISALIPVWLTFGQTNHSMPVAIGGLAITLFISAISWVRTK